ncbi:Aste57867_11067 [Aphanomyces stellatus]|uniref:Aste57867_11067 protein n=1 Tax=Aphanomyces stellatus TaxID=120398 RepID=A0A485KSD7_9STRA|nr:hypothetical protein As57867_011025 [Aphanomyces stellatus]VFT87935.1 Aste57867_11067 [Aphanomyces stellatus]
MQLFFAAVAALAASASAHISLNPAVSPANSYFVPVLRVPHSYPGANTTNITVTIPTDKVSSVKPQQVDEWKVAFEYETINGTKAVSKVTWYGGSLPNSQYQDFGMNLKLMDLPVGTVIYFPTTQVSDNGTLAWVGVPDAAGKLSASEPAPKITIVKA